MINEPNQAQPDSQATSQEKNEDTPIHFGFVEPSIPAKKIWLGGALSFSILGLWFIYEATFTDAGEQWLPYSMDTAQVLLPEAPDGQEQLELLHLPTSLSKIRINIR